MSADLADDVALARSIAAEAGALLLRLRAERSDSGRTLGDCGDREANRLILARLHAERPLDFVLSEESTDDRARCSARRVWIVDPLDGTREYSSGDDDWAVHVGLAVDGEPVAGAVAVPALDRVYTSADRYESGAIPTPPRMVVSATRASKLVCRVAEAIGATTIGMGSAGAKAMAVVDGRADIYLHEGGQYEWDNCAPVAVALAAGLHASRIDGSPLRYNCHDPYLPDLLICRRELADIVLDAIATARGAERG